MLSWEQRVEKAVLGRRLFRRGNRVVVAVSGGIDSMVLLHLLAELSSVNGWNVCVAHFNHQLRGRSSVGDEQLVRRTAKKLKLPVVVGRADVPAFAERKGISIEMAARHLRHQFFAKVARRARADRVALAHHMDDQVELFFLRLLRGSGGQGLAGMKWSSPSPYDPSVRLVRPLLSSSKSELLEYATRRRLTYRHDASNDLLQIQRNRIRHELLPLLQAKYHSGVRDNVRNLMEIVGAESELVEKLAQAWLRAHGFAAPDSEMNRAASAGPPVGYFESTPFPELPLALQRRCLQLQLLTSGIQPEFDLVEHLRVNPGLAKEAKRLSGANPPKRKPAGSLGRNGIRIVREESGAVRPAPLVESRLNSCVCELEMNTGRGSMTWEGVHLAWRVLARKGAARPGRKAFQEWFDADAVGGRIRIRHWQPGDRFQPIGMGKSVKLQDLFVNQKVPRARRKELVVAVTAAGELFWVEGLRISERFKLSSTTNRRLQWQWQRL